MVSERLKEKALQVQISGDLNAQAREARKVWFAQVQSCT